MKDNRIICDLSKVQWARFGYRNQHGNFRNIKPSVPTVYDQSFCLSDKLFMSDNGETLLDYAMKNRLLDVWTPEVKLKITANCTLTYTGDKAVALYKAYCERQFNKKK